MLYHVTNNSQYWSEWQDKPKGEWLWFIEEFPDKSVILRYKYNHKDSNFFKGYKGCYKNVEEAKKYAMNCTESCNSFAVSNGNWISFVHSSNLATSDANAWNKPEPKSPWGCKPAKKEKEDNLMYNTVKIAPAAYATVSAPESDTQKKIDYLRERARGVKYDLSDALGKQFKLHETPGPKTIEDLTAAIKAGEFTVDEKMSAKDKEYFENYGYHRYSPVEMLKFTNFAGPDKEGYKKASKALADEYQKIKDIIQIKSADEALEAIQAFEKWTYAD